MQRVGILTEREAGVTAATRFVGRTFVQGSRLAVPDAALGPLWLARIAPAVAKGEAGQAATRDWTLCYGAKDAGTRFNHAVLFLMCEHGKGTAGRERRWLIGYPSGRLLDAVGRRCCQPPPLNEERRVEDCERAAKTVYEALRARRLASKLEQVEGRTPEETAAFLEGARRYPPVHAASGFALDGRTARLAHAALAAGRIAGRPHLTGCKDAGSVGFAASTPWGESFADLADAVLADKSAPPVLLLAAFLYKRGAEARLRSLIAEAVALNG